MASSLIWLSFLPGLAATAATALYAAKDVPRVGPIVAQIEDMGFTDHRQKVVIAGCWGALWVVLFVAMTSYALMVPDTLGWGLVTLDASFGMLRFNFVLTSISGFVLVSALFSLWDPHHLEEASLEYAETKWNTFKKALYIELAVQLVLYVLMLVSAVDWSVLLIVLAAHYLDAKKRNFMLMYVVLVSISLLFDVVHAAELPSFANMTPGEGWGAQLWIFIFALKPLILATIYAYEKYEPYDDGAAYGTYHANGVDAEVAE